MSRKKKEEEEAISLFPFLSILACLIGTLTMMITAMAMSQMSKDEPQDEAEIKAAEERLEDFRKLQEEMASLKQSEDNLRKKLHEAEELRKDEAKLKELRQKALMAQVSDGEDDGVAKILAQIEEFDSEVKKMSPELKVAKTELEKLNKEMEARKNPQAKVSIIGGGSGSGLKPFFVECATNQVVIHLKDQKIEVPRDQVRKSEQFDSFLADVGKADGASVVFLIREDGIKTFNDASRHASAKGVRNGKLPIIGQGEIDLSFFGGK